jgi:hypothetical protein
VCSPTQAGERVELLAYQSVTHDGARMCGFEVRTRDHADRFWDQVAAGEAEGLDEAKPPPST